MAADQDLGTAPEAFGRAARAKREAPVAWFQRALVLSEADASHGCTEVTELATAVGGFDLEDLLRREGAVADPVTLLVRCVTLRGDPSLAGH